MNGSPSQPFWFLNELSNRSKTVLSWRKQNICMHKKKKWVEAFAPPNTCSKYSIVISNCIFRGGQHFWNSNIGEAPHPPAETTRIQHPKVVRFAHEPVNVKVSHKKWSHDHHNHHSPWIELLVHTTAPPRTRFFERWHQNFAISNSRKTAAYGSASRGRLNGKQLSKKGHPFQRTGARFYNKYPETDYPKDIYSNATFTQNVTHIQMQH